MNKQKAISVVVEGYLALRWYEVIETRDELLLSLINYLKEQLSDEARKLTW